ncbi:TetR/AcrR family transcriptional regulator [Candidatus Kaistella beijingensis]|uniref:TetR/AcrR family transcriptional regulator n=1 Tax=Candidatus Kaistella beijingensis TaxID=2820270 RepID=UPI001CC4D51B|nr:TetR/AcrR family transcriptional regulator [Candidatus Kaistella beijingensis]UBB90175.1 TetR/AcrR family transcriptional regulator [Candidatus Kaistella beijingensis]
MENNLFLLKATELFIENGAKTLTMDDVAKEFGISKKTLYQKYKNKEALLEDVLDFKLKEIIFKMLKLDVEIENAVERMFCRDEQIEKAVKSNDSMLIKQLVKYYPSIFNKHMLNFSEKFAEVLVRNIEKGRKQGYYRTDFDASIYSKLFFQLMMSYESSPFFDTSEIDREEFHQEAMMLYMNAITTEKGREILKKIYKSK